MWFLFACSPSPTAGAVVIAPGELHTNDIAVATVSGVESEVAWTWDVDGTAYTEAGDRLDGGAWQTVTSDRTRFDRGQTVRARAAFVDGGVSVELWSEPVVVANTPPEGGRLGIEADADGTLRAVVLDAPTDADGDPVTYGFAWVVDGVDADVPGDVVTPATAARGREWTATLIPSDDLEAGAAVSATFVATGPVPRQYAFVPAMRLAYGADLAPLPDGSLLVATLVGDLVHVDPELGTELGRTTLVGPEEELISIAVDPRFGDGTHDKAYTWTSQSCVLRQYDVVLDPFAVTHPVDLWDPDCPEGGGHSTGDLVFWAEETGVPALYMTVGPMGDKNSQDGAALTEGINAWLVDPAAGTLAPALVGPWAEPAKVAMGLRNPWRMTDCGAVLCSVDPGKDDYEELNLYRAAGVNFGAGVVEGPDPERVYEDPVRSWEHHDARNTADDLDGGGVQRFTKTPSLGVRASGAGYGGRLENVLLYGEFYDGWIRGLPIDETGKVGDDVPLAHARHVTAMAETTDGTIWALELGGTLQRLVVRADRPTVGEPGALLSASTYPEGGLAYEVRYPMWANDAVSERMIQVPEGESLEADSYGPWIVPEGTRLWQTLTLYGDRVETRLLERQAGGWVAGVYVWQGDDAVLTDGTRQTLSLPSGVYTVPSQATCAFCHTGDGDDEWPLGVESFQLGDAGILALAPVIEGELPEVPETVGDDFAGVRGMLHGNCAYCHGQGHMASVMSETQLEYGYEVPGLAGVNEPVDYFHDLTPYGKPSEYLVVPGDSVESMMVRMLKDMTMPPAAVWEPDALLIGRLSDWIDQMDPQPQP